MKNPSALLNRKVLMPVILLLIASLAFGQSAMQPQSVKGAVIKGKAPVSREVLKVSLPKAYETGLSNGLQVLVLENHKLPTFAMQMVIRNGGISDPPGRRGLATFTAMLLREGTKTRNSRQIAEQVDSLGATLAASSGLSSTESMASASGLTDNLDQVMELFADVILNPAFPSEELTKLKTRMIAQLRMQRSQPAFLAMEMFAKVMYGDHPASHIAPAPEEIQALTPEMLAGFHAAHYRPNNATFAIVGDVKPQAIVARLEKAFGSWQRGEVPQAQVPRAADAGATKIYVVDRPGSVQTNFALGTLAIERTDPDYYALQVMNRIVGGGPSGRLFMNLREDKGYTYGAYSNVSAFRYRGTFQASTQVRTGVTGDSMKELMYEFKRIRDEKVLQEEFENAKRAIVGSFALQLESPQALLQNILTQKLYGLPADYWDTYPQKISALTAEEVQRVANKYVDLQHLQVVAVGDAKQISEPLRKYGTVEIYDADGKPVKAGVPATATAMPAATTARAGTPSRPDFSGTWKMNAAKSDFGMMPAPSSLVQKITHNDPSLKVASTQVSDRGEFTIDASYTTDGKECVNKIMNFDARSALRWDGNALVIDSKMEIQGNVISISQRWTLSDDGKTLTIAQHFAAPQGEMDMRTVLEKQ